MTLRMALAFMLALPYTAFAGVPPRPSCEAKVQNTPATFESLISALEERQADLALIVKTVPLEAEKFLAVFVKIHNTARAWNDLTGKPQSDIFMTWMQDYAIQVAKLTEQFLQMQKDPLPKSLAEKLISTSGNFHPAYAIRLSVLHFAVSHSSMAALGLTRSQKAWHLSEAISTATFVAPRAGHLESFWGDLFLDLSNWSFLASPDPSDLIEKVNRVIGHSLDYVGPNQLSSYHLRFLANALELLPAHLGAKSTVNPQMRNTWELLQRHEEQLRRKQPRLFHRFSPYFTKNPVSY